MEYPNASWCDWCPQGTTPTSTRWLYDFFGEPQLSICEACDALHSAASCGDGEGVVEVGGEGSAQVGGAGASAGLGAREADGGAEHAVTPLAEIPQGCSSKFPTLVGSDSRQGLLR